MAQTRVKLFWYGDAALSRIQLRLENNLRNAAKMLRDAISEWLKRQPWGSYPVGVNLRFRDLHSAPGNPPFKQTGNYANSIQAADGGRSFSPRRMKSIVYVFTDVPYAPSLEYGGKNELNPPQPYSMWRLVNPITWSIYIAPRPHWRSIFKIMVPKLLKRIAR